MQGFADHLDQLIALFKKLQAQQQLDKLSSIDKSFFQTVDILVQNYDLIRKTVPAEMLNQLGSPIHDIIVELITQLKQELGENKDNNEIVDDILSEISTIDEMLSEGNLSTSDIDELLDERSRLMQQRDQKKG